MKFWQSLAFVELDQLVELARFCEELGFHGVSYGDHLVTTREQVDAYLYSDSGNIIWNPATPWPDPWVLTAACLSGDRVTLGVGVGWQKAEFDMAGQDFHTRGRRTDEMLEILPRLMSGEMTEYQGTHYPLPPVQMSPGTGKAFEIWTGVKNPGEGCHQRLAEAGVTMVNGCHFLSDDGRTTLSSLDDKKRRLESFAIRFLRP